MPNKIPSIPVLCNLGKVTDMKDQIYQSTFIILGMQWKTRVVFKMRVIEPEAFCLRYCLFNMSVLILIHKINITRMSQISKLSGSTTKK